MKLSLRMRFVALMLPTALLVVGALVVGFSSYHDIRAGFADLKANQAATLAAERLVRAVDGQIKEFADVVGGDDPGARANIERARAEAEAAIVAWKQGMTLLPFDSQHEALLAELAHVEDQYRELTRTGEHVLALAAKGNRREANALIESDLDLMTPGSLRSSIEQFLSEEEQHLRAQSNALQLRLAGFGVGAGLVALLILIASIVAPWTLGRWLLLPIRDLDAASRLVAAGDLTARVPVRTHDELGALCGTFNAMTVDLETGRNERLKTETELRAARDAAQTASLAKSEFLANMSHEIRTPLNGVLGMIELSLDSTLDAEQREYLSTAQTSAEGLLEVINDILDFSKIEAGHLELDPQPFDLRGVVERVGKTLALRAHQKGLEMICQIADEVPDRLVGDETRVRQVLVNLIGNAVKFTEEGEIVLSVDVERDRHDVLRMKFQVSDTGIGIPTEKQPMIFESFTQADASTTRRYGGTGLGLAISSRLVALMGGTLGVESSPGRGSAFSFTLDMPRSKVQPMPLDREIKELLGGLPALVVDDNATNRRILEHMMVRWGADVQSVESGARAISALEVAVRSGRPFALVLLDANMPGMDGFSLAEEILRRPALAAPEIMMLSSAHRPGDLARCRELGVAMHLIKPVGRADLRAAVVQVLTESRGHARVHGMRSELAPGAGVSPAAEVARAPETASRILSAAGPRRHLIVLLAEDNPVNQRFAARVLEKEGHKVVLARDGAEALACIRSQRFDVVLMDVQMPELSGLEVSKRVRAEEVATGAHVPIVALTAHAMKGDREECLAAGMDSYVSKPVRRAEMLAAIDLAIEVANTALRADEPRRSSPSPPDGQATEAAAFDAADLLERFEGNAEFIVEVTQIFNLDMPQRVESLKAALRNRDAPEISRHAHSMKGALATMSAGPAGAWAAAIEAAAADSRIEEIESMMTHLESELARLRTALDDYQPPESAAA